MFTNSEYYRILRLSWLFSLEGDLFEGEPLFLPCRPLTSVVKSKRLIVNEHVTLTINGLRYDGSTEFSQLYRNLLVVRYDKS